MPLATCMHTFQLQDEMDCDPKVWRDLAKERILRSADAALIVLHITTAPNMPKNVHLEESIEQIITLTKYHLESNIYPQFDPVYRAENKGMLAEDWTTGTTALIWLCVFVVVQWEEPYLDRSDGLEISLRARRPRLSTTK